jgi:hypothetical protein
LRTSWQSDPEYRQEHPLQPLRETTLCRQMASMKQMELGMEPERELTKQQGLEKGRMRPKRLAQQLRGIQHRDSRKISEP